MRIGIVGGTGREGRGLALRWARAGPRVALGSRDEARARARPRSSANPDGRTDGEATPGRRKRPQVVPSSRVPYAAHGETLRALAPHLAGSVVIDITVPLRPPRSAGAPARRAGRGARGAGHPRPGDARGGRAPPRELGAPRRLRRTRSTATSSSAPTTSPRRAGATSAWSRTSALRAFDAGPLRNAIALESLTPVLLHLDKKYKKAGIGIRFVGLD